MQLHTTKEVQALVETFCNDFTTYSKAAKAIGCTQSQLSLARTGGGPPCPAILAAIGVERANVYVSNLPSKYREA